MRRRLVVGLAIALAMVGGGCDDKAKTTPGHDSQWGASSAGIACQLLEYDAVAKRLGTTFDNAGGATKDTTLTCALTVKNHPYPYVTLALTPTTIDSVVFTESVKPQGTYSMPDLGQIAYRQTVAAAGDVGPALQLVWLSETSRLMILKYGFPVEATPADVDAMTPKLLALAQDVEKALPG